MNNSHRTWSRPLLRAAALAAAALVLSACGGGSSSDASAVAGGTRVGATAVTTADAQADVKVVSLTKVSEVRVGRTSFDYTFGLTVQNTGSAAYGNVALTLVGVGAGASIVDGSVSAGTLAAGASATPADTITIRQDRTTNFDGAALTWRVTGDGGLSPQAQLAALEDSGAIPKLERGATLLGVDVNANGVRDDVEAWIDRHYAAGAQRAAAMQAARAFQATLSVDVQSVAAAKAASRTVGDAVRCVFVQFPITGPVDPARVVKELEAMTTNTKPRLLAYLAYNKALDGTSSSLPEGNTCE